jgi:hypothetical protein
MTLRSGLFAALAWIVVILATSENVAAYVAWIVWTLVGGPRENWPGGAWG